MTPQIYLDCDGVLADFDRGAEAILGLPPRAFEKRHGIGQFWKRLARAPDFYAKLEPLPDAMELFEGVRALDPVILTGLPMGGWAEAQKQRWAAQHFPGVRIICCMARAKREHCRPGDVLIDDTLKYRHLWEEAGGVFIHHHSARQSLAELDALYPDLRTKPD
jgi:hypothetical protein